MHYPENREELREIIIRAGETGTGLVPVSSDAPHIHGASENPGAETVCFEKMNRILRIDRKNRYARVEAGVKFGELIPKMAEQGLRLNLPFLPREGKSAVASALEREAVLMPKYQYDYTDPLLTLEAIFGTGDDFRTGSAAGPGPAEELKADMVAPWGPGTIDYMRFLTGAQGTMGFVTWATLKAEVAPKMTGLFFVEGEELSPLVRLAGQLLRSRVPDECIILNAVNFAAAFSEDAYEQKSVQAAAAPWTLICRISGFDRYPEKRIEIYEKYLNEICEANGSTARCRLVGNEGLEPRVDKMLGDCDRREVYWKMRRGGLREIQFLVPPSKTAVLTGRLIQELEQNGLWELGVTVQPQVQGRAFRVEADMYFSQEDRNRACAAAGRAERMLLSEGAFFDRPYGELGQLVYASDPMGRLALQKLKGIFDPKGILNPGKLCF